VSERLTPERLFSAPPLTRGAPADLKFAPDGQYLTYRRAADDDRERMDLWQIDLASGEHSLLLDARHLAATSTDVTELTAEERAERERRRQFSHGINAYRWHPDGERLVIPMDGQVFLVRVDTDRPDVTAVCPPGTRQSGVQVSPNGRFVSYVRDGDLYITEVAQQREQRLTQDASDVVKNGLPDFLAAEEMHRFEGHWWTTDERQLVFTRVDESPVAVSHRLELDANGARTITQRYPYTGAVNPDVSLWCYDLGSGACQCIWRNIGDAAYLARVHTSDAGILIQTQDRLQQHLELSLYDASQGQWQALYTEHSATWINLTDDFRALPRGYVITSEQHGTRQALLLAHDGTRQPLSGPTHINAVHAYDDITLWVSGWHDTPIENHLFAIALDGSGFHQLTQARGWHTAVVDVSSGRYLDYFSSVSQPPQLTLAQLTDDPPGTPSEAMLLYAERFADDHPYAPYLPLHATAEFGEIPAADGQTLHYRLTPPAEISGTHPTIVYVYGGPGPQKATNEWSPLLVQLFAQQGFAVLEIDNRGSGNRGREFEAPIYEHMGSVEVADQVTGLAALDDVAWADRSRVGIFGHSYGGYMTLMCLSQAGAHFRSGVAVAPVADWALYDTHYTERYMGLPDDNKDGYRDANVLTHLHKLSAPLLLMHGMADDNVLFTHSTMIMARLQQLGTAFDLMTYPGAKHSMQERDVSIHRFNMILDFFKRTLT